jgi:hypothetical protein
MVASRGILVYILKFMFAFFVIAAIVLQGKAYIHTYIYILAYIPELFVCAAMLIVLYHAREPL